jgi:hypothetical protein
MIARLSGFTRKVKQKHDRYGFGCWVQLIARRLKDHADFDPRWVVEPVVAAHGDIDGMDLTLVASDEDAIADPPVQAVILTLTNAVHNSQIERAIAACAHVFCINKWGEIPNAVHPDAPRRQGRDGAKSQH